MNASQPAVFADLTNGRVLHAFGEEIMIHLDSESTGGTLNLWTELTPPGAGPPPHYHEHEDEWFVVQEGNVEFFSDGNWKAFAPGAVLFMPRNHVHGFRNAGQTTSRMLLTTAPGGFDRYLARCAEEFAKRGEPGMDHIIAISAEHGIHFAT